MSAARHNFLRPAPKPPADVFYDNRTPPTTSDSDPAREHQRMLNSDDPLIRTLAPVACRVPHPATDLRLDNEELAHQRAAERKDPRPVKMLCLVHLSLLGAEGKERRWNADLFVGWSTGQSESVNIR